MTALPVVRGDWVATIDDYSFQVGRVRDCYADDKGVAVDIVLYAPDGTKVGRASPAGSGPRSFEPAISWDGTWRRIEPPSFPIVRQGYSAPMPGTDRVTIRYDFHRGVTTKPVRTEPVQRKARSVAIRRVRSNKNFDPELEKAALRRAAQELRGAARKISAEEAGTLKTRAAELEAEADRL